MIKKIKKYKSQVIGALVGLLIYFAVIFPLMLDFLLDTNESFLWIWATIGVSFVLFLYLLSVGAFLGYAIGKLIENVKGD